MNTEITNAVNAAGDKAQYDARVKRILAQKNIYVKPLNSTWNHIINKHLNFRLADTRELLMTLP